MAALVRWRREGYTFEEIYRHLRDYKVKTRTGREWSLKRIQQAYQAAVKTGMVPAGPGGRAGRRGRRSFAFGRPIAVFGQELFEGQLDNRRLAGFGPGIIHEFDQGLAQVGGKVEGFPWFGPLDRLGTCSLLFRHSGAHCNTLKHSGSTSFRLANPFVPTRCNILEKVAT